MRFTKEEITSKRFSKAIKGCDKIEVDTYLELLADKISEIQLEIKNLKKEKKK